MTSQKSIADKAPRRDEFGATRRARHLRHDGSHKFDWRTRDAAAENAAALSVELGYPFQPYDCEHCGGWHVGAAPDRHLGVLRGEMDQLEVGYRVATALRQDNHPIRRHRRGTIKSRFFVASKRRKGAQIRATIGVPM